jgi:cardiolipin synthase A/B
MRSVTYVAANDVTLLESGTAFFPALVAAIDAARYDILFETYIWAEDAVGDQVRDALIRAAQRGVKVRVIVDWFGTGHRVATRLSVAFAESNVHYRIFNAWFRRGIARSHRKIAVVDREVAFVGGININDDMFCDYDPKKPLPAPRWDFAVEVRGPLVATIHHEAQAQWARVGHMNIIRRLGLFREMRRQPLGLGERPMQAAFVVRDNLRNRRTIQRAYLQALGRAKRSVLIANPYFAPGRKLREALAQAAQRGVDVRLLIGVGEFHLQDMVAHSFYPKLLAAGVKVYEYHKTQLHAKVAVVDDDWATVGSSNYDALSLFINQEANVVVRDPVFAGTVRRHVERGILDAVPIGLEDIARFGWARRCCYGFAYRVYKLMMRLFAIGYA